MKSFRNNNRRGRFRSNDRNFKRNGESQRFSSDFSSNSNFKRKSPGRNNHNAPKLIEKYNDLAREALSNGDKILSENYLQHADHFTRILNERESFRKEKFLESKSENNSGIVEESVENSEQNSEKDLVETSSDETNIQKSAKTQVEIN